MRVKYFGRIRELMGVREEEYEVEDVTLAKLLLECIPGRHKDSAEEFKKLILGAIRGNFDLDECKRPVIKDYIVLVSGRVVEATYKLRVGDEVAILPPVGGGLW